MSIQLVLLENNNQMNPKERKLRKIIREEVKKQLNEEATFEGDQELNLPNKAIKALKKAKSEKDIKKILSKYGEIVSDVFDISDQIETYLGGYAEIWKGILTINGKSYNIKGVEKPEGDEWEYDEEWEDDGDRIIAYEIQKT